MNILHIQVISNQADGTYPLQPSSSGSREVFAHVLQEWGVMKLMRHHRTNNPRTAELLSCPESSAWHLQAWAVRLHRPAGSYTSQLCDLQQLHNLSRRQFPPFRREEQSLYPKSIGKIKWQVCEVFCTVPCTQKMLKKWLLLLSSSLGLSHWITSNYE